MSEAISETTGKRFGVQRVCRAWERTRSSMDLFVADTDEDDDLDVASAHTISNEVAWRENNGGFIFWPEHTISVVAEFATDVHASDFDADGDVDVFSASLLDEKIVWYENDGSTPPLWQPHILSSVVNGARAVAVADVDSDSLLDVISASEEADGIALYKQVRPVTNPSWVDTDLDGHCDRASKISPCVGNEVAVGTDPTDADSDADGLQDGFELSLGLVPPPPTAIQMAFRMGPKILTLMG